MGAPDFLRGPNRGPLDLLSGLDYSDRDKSEAAHRTLEAEFGLRFIESVLSGTWARQLDRKAQMLKTAAKLLESDRIRGNFLHLNPSEQTYMAKQANKSGVYRVTEIIGTSPVSWENAAKKAVETAAKSLRDLRVAEISKLDMKIEGGKVVAYRARVSLSFKYDA